MISLFFVDLYRHLVKIIFVYTILRMPILFVIQPIFAVDILHYSTGYFNGN
jgi:hypothetical protein